MNKKDIPFYRFMLSDIHDDAPRDHSISAERMLKRLMEERSASVCDFVREHMSPEHFPLMSLDPELHRLLAVSSVIWLLTRISVGCGLNEFDAFGISNYYTRKLSEENSELQMKEILYEAAESFVDELRLRDRAAAMPRAALDGTGGEDAGLSPLVSEASSYVLRNIRSPLSVRNISEALFCSADYLSARFHKETGQTLGNYIRHHKIELAKEMLRFSDFPVGEIAVALSFSSASHLIRVFSQEAGMTPGEYRKNNSSFRNSAYYLKLYKK